MSMKYFVSERLKEFLRGGSSLVTCFLLNSREKVLWRVFYKALCYYKADDQASVKIFLRSLNAT